ncbi:hypothetical protein JCGZ_18812 [Jatropha curcas]|uniref:Uncharacterized protein n=1 Tax=Jatropha curcas TaxID=180498 RepID=A0A067KBM6_JATCU|nr:hypothetical protein JCGZ_18812 [Jatropha curcas]
MAAWLFLAQEEKLSYYLWLMQDPDQPTHLHKAMCPGVRFFNELTRSLEESASVGPGTGGMFALGATPSSFLPGATMAIGSTVMRQHLRFSA